MLYSYLINQTVSKFGLPWPPSVPSCVRHVLPLGCLGSIGLSAKEEARVAPGLLGRWDYICGALRIGFGIPEEYFP